MAKSQLTYRVFVSSTYEDMIDYRDAAMAALTSIDILPVGMEQFVASPDKSLDVCLSEVRRCQLFIAIVGMRYGSIDDETGKSYSELEYEEAVKNGIPVLAFIIDENECPVLPKFVDVGEKATKLKKFKETLNQQRYTSRFKSIVNLKELVVRSVTKQVNDTSKEKTTDHIAVENKYKDGAILFKKFMLLPERYKNTEAVLRVRFDGKFGTWLVREALFEAFGLDRGDTIFCNDVSVLGADFSDIDDDSLTIDVFAEGKCADWIVDNNITFGHIIEAKFMFAYEFVPGVKNSGYKKAVLIMKDGLVVIGKDKNKKSQTESKKDRASSKHELAKFFDDILG